MCVCVHNLINLVTVAAQSPSCLIDSSSNAKVKVLMGNFQTVLCSLLTELRVLSHDIGSWYLLVFVVVSLSNSTTLQAVQQAGQEQEQFATAFT